jgi:phenylalanyl-tRNA synthetase beta chain
MPVVDIDTDELRRLTGTEHDDDRLKEDLFGLGMEFEGETENGKLQFEFAPDRLDRLSVEGVARSLRYQYGTDRGVYRPTVNDPEWSIVVEESVPDERPYVTGAVVRGLDLTEGKLESLIQLQEKLHATIGRGRAKGAIGVHDLTMLKGAAYGESEKTITYRGVEPEGDRFVALDADSDMTPAEVLTDHPVGRKYADLVAGHDRYPAIYDDIGLFSFPPVINGARTEVSTDSRDLFVEMTGTDQWTIDRMLNVVCYALDARGGRVEEVRVEYPDTAPYQGDLVRPDLSTKQKTVAHNTVESVLGVSLAEDDVIDYLERSGLGASVVEGEDAYEAEIPPYRVDVLHPMDVVDDIGRAHGFDDLEPRYPEVSTVGGRHERSRLEDAVRETLVGLGFQDTLNFHLTSEADCFERMGLAVDDDAVGAAPPITIAEPYSEEYTIVRTWALPSLVQMLGNNTHRPYPQELAEVGFAAHVDDSRETKTAERRTVAAVLARTDASYEDARGRLEALARAFGAGLATPRAEHPSFIDGRTAAVELDGERVGVVGELHPRVLVGHDLEVPAVGFEFRLDGLA